MSGFQRNTPQQQSANPSTSSASSTSTGAPNLVAAQGQSWGAPFPGTFNVGGGSMAENPNFEAEAAQFETKLGALAFGHAGAERAASAATAKAVQYIDARGSIKDKLGDAGKSVGQLFEMCGGDATWMAGNVGKEVDDVKAVMTGGNLRERLTAWHHFIEEVVAGDLLKPDNQFAELSKIMTDAGMNLQKLQQWRAQQTALPPDQQNKKSLLWEEPAGSPVSDLRTMRSKRDAVPGAAQPGASTQTALTTQSPQIGGLSGREAEHMGLSTVPGANGQSQPDPTKDEVLKWGEGAKSWIMNESDKWVQLQRKISVPLRAGPSGHTNSFFNGNSLLGVGASGEDMRLACIGYLLPINAHSLVEVLAAAAAHGVPYTQGRRMYRDLPPLSEGELRSCGVGNRFPDEAPGAMSGAGGQIAGTVGPTPPPPAPQAGPQPPAAS